MSGKHKVSTSLLKMEATAAPWQDIQLVQSIILSKVPKGTRNKLYRAAVNGYGITKSGFERAVFFFLSRAFSTPSSYISNATHASFLTVAKDEDLKRQKNEAIAALAMFQPNKGEGRGWRHSFSIETQPCGWIKASRGGVYEDRYIRWQVAACCPEALLGKGYHMFSVYGPGIPIERLHMVADCMGAKETRAKFATEFDRMAAAIDSGETVTQTYHNCSDEE